MPSRELPDRVNLHQYRKQAKELFKRYKAGNSEALSRIREHHPNGRNTSRDAFALSDAQWTLAREHGFESWPKFVKHLAGTGSADAASPGHDTHVQLEISVDEVNLAVFLEEGSRLLTAAQGDPVTLWNAQTGRRLHPFGGYSIHAWALRPLVDPRLVMVGCRDGAVRLVRSDTDEIVHTLTGHSGMVRCLDVSPDMKLAISGAGVRDPAIRIWDVAAERCTHVLEGHRDGVYSVAFDADQRRALSGSRDTTVRLWDLERAKCTAALEGHTYHVHAVAWAADGRRALSCSQDIRLWDVARGRCLQVFDGHTETIRSVAWSPDHRHALSASHDRTIRVWDVERGECVEVLAGHSTGVVNAVWSADGRRVFSCDWDGEVRTWQPFSVRR